MRPRISLVSSVCIAFFVIISVDAADLPFLPEAQLMRLIQSIPMPPEKGTPQETSDLNTILTIQTARTPAQCKIAQSEATPSLQQFFGKPDGPLSVHEVKKLEPIFQQVLAWIRPTIGKAKDHFQRPRPFVVSAAVQPCLDRDESSSYPSGHSILATLVGRILSDWDPARQYDFQSRVHSISKNRVIAGVHYPSDLSAGEDLGKKIYQRLKGTPGYSQWLAEFTKSGK